MEKMLKRNKVITVADLRSNRELRNDITGDIHPDLTGYVRGISGDLDSCKITDNDRMSGININDLIG